MTTHEAWQDGSSANLQKAFPRTGSWTSLTLEAAEWLSDEIEKEFPDLIIHAFVSDPSARKDNRISRHRKISGLPIFKTGALSDSKIVDEGMVESKDGIFFWIHFQPSKQGLPSLIDMLRSDRGSFIFLAQPDFPASSFVEIIVKPRTMDKHISIDQEDTIQSLIKSGVRPIRVWGNFDDRDLWIELY